MIRRVIATCLCACFIASACFCFLWVTGEKEVLLKNNIIDELTIRLATFEPQLKFNIENVGKHIPDIAITDSIGNKKMLSEYIVNRKKIVICRFSMRFCQECNEYAINTILGCSSLIDFGNLLFISDSINNRIHKVERATYNISNKYGIGDCNDLKIPAENVMFPYYLVIDNKLRISNIYFPNKESKNLGIDTVNLQLILKSLVD